jgi:hypothetical protein
MSCWWKILQRNHKDRQFTPSGDEFLVSDFWHYLTPLFVAAKAARMMVLLAMRPNFF